MSTSRSVAASNVVSSGVGIKSSVTSPSLLTSFGFGIVSGSLIISVIILNLLWTKSSIVASISPYPVISALARTAARSIALIVCSSCPEIKLLDESAMFALKYAKPAFREYLLPVSQVSFATALTISLVSLKHFDWSYTKLYQSPASICWLIYCVTLCAILAAPAVSIPIALLTSATRVGAGHDVSGSLLTISPPSLSIWSTIICTSVSACVLAAALPAVPLVSCVSVFPLDTVTAVSSITSPITSLSLP